MSTLEAAQPRQLVETARALALEGFRPPEPKSFGSHPAWAGLRGAGTLLWLDTGDLDAAAAVWTGEFTNLTTNNSLVNKEVQKGLFDQEIARVGRALKQASPDISPDELVWEIGFVLNCRVALRLVQAFGATVSVELHPSMADDAAVSVAYGRRYYAVCPDHFIVKVPLTPAGFLAARRLASGGIPINYTLGFSARQNVLAAAFSRPAFVNVFMGRLNEFADKNGLGSGRNMGEKTTMASQMALLEGRERRGWVSRQIGASMREAEQVESLAGLDVYTLPTKVAEDFRKSYEAAPRPIRSQIGRDFPVEADPISVFECLWHVDDGVREAARALETAPVADWTGGDFAAFVRDHGAPDLFRQWTREELDQITQDGKIPSWARWQEELRAGRLALDDLMTTSAIRSFAHDQGELDGRIARLLQEARVH